MNRIKIVAAFFFVSCFLPINLFAQKAYSLEQCKSMALENNNSIKNSRLDIEIASQTRKEAFTNYFPSVSATGMTFEASEGMAQMDLMLPNMPQPLPMSLLKNGKIAGITALQPIFAGGQIITGNKLARLGQDVSKYKLQLSENEVIEITEKYFWQIVSLKEKLKTIATVEAQLNQIAKDVDMAVKAGITTRNDLLRIELQQQNVASNRLKIENGLSISQMLLRQHIGAETTDFEIAFDGFGDLQSPEVYYISAEEAVYRRTEVQLLDKSVQASKLQKQMTVGKNLPTLGVGVGYMYHDLLEKDTDFGVVFASVSVPISSWWGGSHSIKREKFKQQQAENNRQNTIEFLTVDIQQRWNELQESYKQIMLAEKSISSATENLRLNENCYKAGTTSISDLLDAQTLFQQSKDQYSDACTEYKQKLTRYLQATGR
ncbi:MAG: TolC family protein [Rikenellaceae bacterium]